MKKAVLTGGFCSGKTSLIVALDLLGEQVVREAASDYIRYQRAREIFFPEERDDFEEQILRLQIERERRIPAGRERVFIDRGTPDSVAFSTLFGWRLPPEMVRRAVRIDYAVVFFVERFGPDWETMISEQDWTASERLEAELLAIYGSLGSPIVRVPAGPLDDRRRFIVEHMADLCP